MEMYASMADIENYVELCKYSIYTIFNLNIVSF